MLEDWNTKRICDCFICQGRGKLDRHYDVLKTSYAKPVETKPLKTDFSKLTETQHAVLLLENAYWKDKPWDA